MSAPKAVRTEVYMILKDRKQLAKLMVIQGVSQRQVAEAAEWKSHSYLGRLLRGEVKTLDPEAAIRIACFFGVGVDDLFVARVSTTATQTASRRPATRSAA